MHSLSGKSCHCCSKWRPIYDCLATLLQALLDPVQTCFLSQNGCQSILLGNLDNHCQLATQNGCHWTLFKAILYLIQTLLAIQNGCQSIFTGPLNSSHSLIQSRPDQLLKMAAHLYLLGHLGNPSQVTSQNGCQSILTWPLNSSHSLIQSRPDNLLKMAAILSS